jgi:hypothetical protein
VLTRYSIARFKLDEKLPDGAEPPAPGVFQALPYALARVSLGGAVELVLERFKIPSHGFRFTFQHNHDGRLLVLGVFHGLGELAMKGWDGMG